MELKNTAILRQAPAKRTRIARSASSFLLALSFFATTNFCLHQTTEGQTLPFSVEFGSSNDRLGGFNQSTVAPKEEKWLLQPTSLRYIVDDPDGGPDFGAEGGNQNGSLLRRFALDRSPGQSYRIKGFVRLVDGYADDNNRIGLYLFGDVDDLGDYARSPGTQERGALSLQYNTDSGSVAIYEGIDLNTREAAIKDGGYLGEDNSIFAGTRLAFTADFRFLEDQNIEVAFTLMDELNDITTVETTVVAADFTGDYFGFFSRARNRGVSVSDRNAPITIDFESFSVTKTDIPEPAAFVLITGVLSSLLLGRRRVASRRKTGTC